MVVADFVGTSQFDRTQIGAEKKEKKEEEKKVGIKKKEIIKRMK
jgi:hypothetical protein